MDMAVFIHRKAKFNRRLGTLKRGGKQSFLAAKRAQKLIKKLFREDLAFLKETDKFTKHGELRIDKCRKYDLGGGYRLICVKRGEDLIISQVGAHDDCDRWIENNRRFEPELSKVREETFLNGEEEPGEQHPEPEPDEEMDYDEILMKKIDDNLLREIFCGLCKRGP
jgi:mRNA-degrading endonuclease RelE of RelBE toxin-antitoxin system